MKIGHLFGTLVLAITVVWIYFQLPHLPQWTRVEMDIIQSLWIGNLDPLPDDTTNKVADDPGAARLGHQLFFDKRLSINGAFSCASCHQPDKRFTDGLVRGIAIGQTQRNTLSIIGGAYSPWQYWDGRKDSQWSQALAPLEHPLELGANRMFVARLVGTVQTYKDAYEVLFDTFPDLSDRSRFPDNAGPVADTEWNAAWQGMAASDRDIVNRIFANIGKSIAAYERLLVPGQSRFDDYVDAIQSGNRSEILNHDEIAGLRLFIGKANCIQCHNGPLFTNNEFHNTGTATSPGEIPDKGRVQGVREASSDLFNCVGVYSASNDHCAELRFARTGSDLIGTMRTPSLRNLEGTAPYMHKGQLATLADVLDHYKEAPLAIIGHNEAKPLNLTLRELDQLEAFLHTLDAPVAVAPEWLSPPAIMHPVNN
ncbi:MAG: cytochrome-c peroxidase [Gammaproteobacteria bacterium]|nr:cytochrome-c peroxidase [Gammaproteobacteria bacterium]